VYVTYSMPSEATRISD